MLAAMTYMHDQGICNRDFKLENMLVGSDFSIKIADFGFASRVEGDQQDGLLRSNLGTPGYMAPEVLERRAYDGKSVDLYALGVILFTLVTVKLPFGIIRTE